MNSFYVPLKNDAWSMRRYDQLLIEVYYHPLVCLKGIHFSKVVDPKGKLQNGPQQRNLNRIVTHDSHLF